MEQWHGHEGGVGAIVHVGIGAGLALGDHLAATEGRIVLVEPNPDVAIELRARIADLPPASRARLKLIEAAVAPADGPVRLQVFNMPDLSSLTAPTGLTEIYPGLRLVAEPEVEGLAPASLAERLGPLPKQGNRLIVEAAGQEVMLVEGLAGAGALVWFDRIDLICGRSPLYKDAAPGEAIIKVLEAQGYELHSAGTAKDPEWCSYLFMRDLNLPQIAALTEEVASLRAELEASGQARDVEAARAEALEAQVTEAAQMQESERAEHVRATAALTEEVASLRAELEASAQDRDVEAARAEALASDLGVAIRVQSAIRADLAQLRTTYAALVHEKEEQDALLLQVTQRLSAAQAYLEGTTMPSPPFVESAASEKGKRAKTSKKVQKLRKGEGA